MRTTSALTIPALADRLRVVLARTARRLRQEAGADLGPTLTAALATVDRHGPLTPSHLAELERIQRPTATRLIRRLEEQGLISRTPVPGDARSCALATTEDGAQLLVALRARKDAFLVRRLRDLSADERRTLADAADILERLLQDGERP